MRRFSLRGRLACGAALSLAMAGAGGLEAQAAEAAGVSSAQPTQIADIIVTANKREERLHDVALSVSALKSKELIERNELNLADFSAQVPSLAIQQQSPGVTRIILRGQNSGGAGATVATLVDDVPFSVTGSTSLAGAIITADIDPYDLNRVEVLRGPQGTLYGAGSEGGIVKYVTNLPNTTRVAGAIEGGFVDVAHGDAAGNVRGFLNLPLAPTIAVRASGFYEGIPGYVDDKIEGLKDVNSGKKYGGRFAILAKPTDRYTVVATAFYQKLRTNGASVVDVVGAATNSANPPANQQSLVDGLNNDTYVPSTQNNESYYFVLRQDLDAGAVKIASITSYGKITDAATSEVSGNLIADGVTYGDFLEAFVYGQPVELISNEANSIKKVNQEFRFSSPAGFKLFSHPMDWQFGAFYTHEDTYGAIGYNTYTRPGGVLIPSPPLGSITVPGYYEEYSGFGEIDYHFTSRFDISVGGRYTSNNQNTTVNYFAGLLTGGTASLPATPAHESAWTWSVAPRFKLSDNTLIYARVASGYRPGGPVLPVPGAPPDAPKSYDSDSTVNYEVGVRSDLLDHHLSLDLSAFYVDWSRIQLETIVQTSVGPYAVTGNGGSARSVGAEWNITWRPIHGLALNDVGAYVDAKLTANAPAFGGVSGDALAYVPDIVNSVNIDYTWRAFGDFDGFIGGTWTHTGRRFTDFPVTAVGHVEMPAYDTLALRLGVKSPRYTAEVFVRNLTDSEALQSYYYGGGVGLHGQAAITEPRTIGVRLGVQY